MNIIEKIRFNIEVRRLAHTFQNGYRGKRLCRLMAREYLLNREKYDRAEAGNDDHEPRN